MSDFGRAELRCRLDRTVAVAQWELSHVWKGQEK